MEILFAWLLLSVIFTAFVALAAQTFLLKQLVANADQAIKTLEAKLAAAPERL